MKPYSILLEYREKELIRHVYGGTDSAMPIVALSFALSVLRGMVEEYPGLPWGVSLDCPGNHEPPAFIELSQVRCLLTYTPPPPSVPPSQECFIKSS